MSPSSSSTVSNIEASSTEESTKSRVPAWIPLSAFVGTSLCLALPLLMVRRQRKGIVKTSLSKGSAPPPRRTTSAAPPIPSTSTSTSSSASQPISYVIESVSGEYGGLRSALAQMNKTNGVMAAKAFGIATVIVATSAFTGIWAIKTFMGVQDTREFGVRMRRVLWTAFPNITSRIHRPPETDEERKASSELAPFGEQASDWTWDAAEKRLERAFDAGGFTLWAQAALHEIEAEARLERARREKEIDESK